MDQHQRTQLFHEIEWLEKEIVKLESQLHRKPSKQKQIDEYRRQIKHKELGMLFGWIV